ncbi:MAG: 1-acyl-sn-glycerol-3-phosphate acyltransferase [Pirellulales bacterium]|nr:1-acyl-sn-glycerol-3-phosphate acyltransferase [Pirellulales bacterium]
MNRQPFAKPPRWWSPKPSRFWMSVWRPLRRRQQIHDYRITEIDVQGLDHVRQAIDAGHGILITPNHPGHGDCYLLWEALIRLRQPCYVMTAWQVFEMAKPLERLIYRQHGCFSVDREGNDMAAMRQTLQVLSDTSNPMVIFPEGDVYHLNERVTPFRDGVGALALSAVKRSGRPVACFPTSLRYEYTQDPTPELKRVMDQLEQRLYWRPRTDLSLEQRIYRFAEGILELKELEYLGRNATGTLSERIDQLAKEILRRIEAHYEVRVEDETIPERVKTLRRLAIERRRRLSSDDPVDLEVARELDDLFFVVQLFSYPGDYVAERPTIERMAETIDKFEEDFLGAASASIRGRRRAEIRFGEPILVREPGKRDSARALVHQLERRVQQMLDDSYRQASKVPA